MIHSALRPVIRLWRARICGALLWFGVIAALPTAGTACTVSLLNNADVVQNSVVQAYDATAWYSALTDRYGHGVLGDALEPTTLHLLTDETSAQCGLRVTLDPPFVFEDVAPRLVDLTGDGHPELIVVRSHADKGAQLAIYGQVGPKLELIASTPFIGQRNRWLAPVGAADLDGDGKIELAYIDRPHLAKTLRIWRFDAGKLVPLYNIKGLTNHRIGEDFISGGIRSCGGIPEIVISNANWTRIVGITLQGQSATQRDLGRFNPANLRQMMDCP